MLLSTSFLLVITLSRHHGLCIWIDWGRGLRWPPSKVECDDEGPIVPWYVVVVLVKRRAPYRRFRGAFLTLHWLIMYYSMPTITQQTPGCTWPTESSALRLETGIRKQRSDCCSILMKFVRIEVCRHWSVPMHGSDTSAPKAKSLPCGPIPSPECPRTTPNGDTKSLFFGFKVTFFSDINSMIIISSIAFLSCYSTIGYLFLLLVASN